MRTLANRASALLLGSHLVALTACADASRPTGVAEHGGRALGDVTAAATGGKIAFLRLVGVDPYNAEIFVMNADGSALTNLTNDPAFDAYPAWSSDGTKIAFGSDRECEPCPIRIWVMNADGSSPTSLHVEGFDPTWSPDGAKIAYSTHVETRAGPNAEIFVVNADGTGATNLTNSPTLGESNPSWSPDGSKIAFVRGEPASDGNEEIWVMNPDGSEQTRLTNDPAEDDDPDWSPDGTKIIFDSARDGKAFDIFVMNADGTDQINLTHASSVGIEEPTYSPDGTRIAFQNQGGVLFVMNADGSGQTSLSTIGDQPDWAAGTIIDLPYLFDGPFPPVDLPPIVNVVTAGRSVPIKFTLGGDRGLDIFRSGFPRFVVEACDARDVQDVIETTTDEPGGLTFDALTGQYNYVWKTSKGYAGRCGRLELGLRDGSEHSAQFQFTR